MIKYYDNEGRPAPNILIIDDMQVINPTREQYESQGWFPKEESDLEQEELSRIDKEKAKKISEIQAYDNSPEVNSFIFNGKRGWFTADTRSNLKTSIDAARLLGEKTIILWFGYVLTLPLETASKMLAVIQRYADSCYMVTQEHVAKVAAMTGIAEIRSFDVTKGYPDILILDSLLS